MAISICNVEYIPWNIQKFRILVSFVMRYCTDIFLQFPSITSLNPGKLSTSEATIKKVGI